MLVFCKQWFVGCCFRVLPSSRGKVSYANDKLLLCTLKELIPTSLLDTLTTIADKRANKTTEQHLTNILKPLTDKSRHKLQSTDNFIDAIKTIQIPDDHKLVSFDVKSLFTSILLQLALDCTKTAIKKSHYQPPLPTDDLMDLLHLCLTSTYFQYNGRHYKQLHGTAMG